MISGRDCLISIRVGHGRQPPVILLSFSNHSKVETLHWSTVDVEPIHLFDFGPIIVPIILYLPSRHTTPTL